MFVIVLYVFAALFCGALAAWSFYNGHEAAGWVQATLFAVNVFCVGSSYANFKAVRFLEQIERKWGAR